MRPLDPLNRIVVLVEAAVAALLVLLALLGVVDVVRKLVIFESGPEMLERAAGLAVLIVAVGVTWYLVNQDNLGTGEPASGDRPSA